MTPRRTVTRRHRWLLGSLIGLLALLANVACGSPTASGQLLPAQLDTSHPYGNDPAEDGTPTSGGTLRVGVFTDTPSFDPKDGQNPVAAELYDSLMRFDEKGEPQPFLAKSLTTADGGATWTLELRPGVTFHDGTPLDADAVVFNIQRHLDDTTSVAYQYARAIKAMTVVDPLTVRFELTEPNGSFASYFALPYTVGNLGTIASPTAVQKWGDEYGTHPVGAGPFEFVEWVPGSQLVVERFDDYWQEGLPHLDRIVYRPLPDTESRYLSLVNGDVDLVIAGYYSEVYRGSTNPDLRTYYGPGIGASYLYFNFEKPPFDDRRMREAIIRAIDPDAMNAAIYMGAMQKANSLIPEGNPLYSQRAADAYPTYDLERAKQLIADYVADGGDKDFALSSSNSPDTVKLATFLQAQWAAAGITVELRPFEHATYNGAVLKNGDFQAATGLEGPWQSPFPLVYSLFYTDGPKNRGGYTNPEVDKALDEAVGAADPAARIAAYQKVQELTTDDLAVAWLSRSYKGTLARPEVRGIIRYLDGEIFYGTIWLAR